jgi:hypothetical protein
MAQFFDAIRLYSSTEELQNALKENERIMVDFRKKLVFEEDIKPGGFQLGEISHRFFASLNRHKLISVLEREKRYVRKTPATG